MPRQEVNRSGEMEVFIRAVELGGFSPAARALRMTPSAVSKLVARLEKRLGARLVNRSTRKLLLTAEGQAFLERAHRILADLDEAERTVATGAVPRGLVRVNCNVPFGLHGLLPLIPRFTATHPEVRLDIVLTDQVVDLMDERADVAIRVGPMRASQLMARKLGQSRMVVVAAPAYLAAGACRKPPMSWMCPQLHCLQLCSSLRRVAFRHRWSPRVSAGSGRCCCERWRDFAASGSGRPGHRTAIPGPRQT